MSNFIGPTEKSFQTFKDLAIYSVENYLPDWKTENYVLPPIFEYTNCYVSDQEVKKTMQGNRLSEKDEHVIYSALNQLASEKYKTPFMAVHSLNLNDLRPWWNAIFPDFQIDQNWEFLRQFDFLIISPLGLVIIEVKGSNFTKPDEFLHGNCNLPADIQKAIDIQLKSFHEFLDFLSAFTGIPLPDDFPVLKILYTPNLEKIRYATWLGSLKTDDQQVILRKFAENRVQHWFKDDMINLDIDKSKEQLFSKLREMLDSMQGNGQEIFQGWAPIIAGLSSIVIRQDNNGTGMKAVELSATKLQERCAISEKASSLPNAAYSNTKINILTRDQQKALGGSKRQFLIGAAGTGKTIILQEKARRLSKQFPYAKLLLCCPDNYKKVHEQNLAPLFPSGFQAFSWGVKRRVLFQEIQKLLPNLNQEFMDISRGKLNDEEKKAALVNFFGQAVPEEVAKLVSDQVQSRHLDDIFEWLEPFDIIFIDDASDREEPQKRYGSSQESIISCIVLMAIAHLKYPCGPGMSGMSKILWIAMDSWPFEDRGSMNQGHIISQSLPALIQAQSAGYYSAILLQRIMRCTIPVFNNAYHLSFCWPKNYAPILGHSIDGVYIPPVLLEESCFGIAMQRLDSAVIFHVQQLLGQGFKPDEFAVLLEGRQGFKRFGVAPEAASYTPELRKTIVKSLTAALRTNDNSPIFMPVVCGCYAASSMEWPVVIYAGLICKSWLHRGAYAYSRYRAKTRATVKLIDITAVYPEESSYKF